MVVLLAGKAACWLAVFCAGVGFSSRAVCVFRDGVPITVHSWFLAFPTFSLFAHVLVLVRHFGIFRFRSHRFDLRWVPSSLTSDPPFLLCLSASIWLSLVEHDGGECNQTRIVFSRQNTHRHIAEVVHRQGHSQLSKQSQDDNGPDGHPRDRKRISTIWVMDRPFISGFRVFGKRPLATQRNTTPHKTHSSKQELHSDKHSNED